MEDHSLSAAGAVGQLRAFVTDGFGVGYVSPRMTVEPSNESFYAQLCAGHSRWRN